MVQCGSCGNKWKQFPLDRTKKNQPVSKPQKLVPKAQSIKPISQKTKKIKKNNTKKPREISLYSPEYLAKKHGIKISDTKSEKTFIKNKKEKVSFGFYNSLILYIVLIISFSRILYFSQEFLINNFPITEFYLNYFFESMKNMFEIWKNLVAS